MNPLIVDIECNNLELRDITNIWCIVAKELDRDVWYYYAPKRFGKEAEFKYAKCYPNLKEFVTQVLAKAECLIFHNGIMFDIPVIQKFVEGFKPRRVEDTFILSSLFEPDRQGGHSLEQWGKDFGCFKVCHEDWTRFSQEMLNRCFRDVELTQLVFNRLNKERSSGCWNSAIKMEYTMARLCAEMKENGVTLDIPLAKSTLKEIVNELETIDTELLSILPKRTVPLFAKNPVTKVWKKDGTFSKQVTDYFGDTNWKET